MGDYPKHTLSNPIYITFQNRENSSMTEKYWLPGTGGGRDWVYRGNMYVLIVPVVVVT